LTLLEPTPRVECPPPLRHDLRRDARLPKQAGQLAGLKGARVARIAQPFELIAPDGVISGLRDHVDHGDQPACPADSRHLPRGERRIVEVVEGEATHDDVELGVREGELGCIALGEEDVASAGVRGGRGSGLEHLAGQVHDHRERRALRQVPAQLPVSTRYVEDDIGLRDGHMLANPVEETTVAEDRSRGLEGRSLLRELPAGRLTMTRRGLVPFPLRSTSR
jgi:hypothetical protein